MEVKTRTAKELQGEETRTELVAAATGLFGERGYKATSLDAIAAEAGVTKGALYHHFSGKDDLFKAVYETVKRDLSVELTRVLPHPDPWTGLKEACRTYIESHTDPSVVRIVLLDARAVLNHDVWREVDRQWGAVMFRGAFRRAMNRGVMVQAPLNEVAMLLTGALAEACLLVANSDDPGRTKRETLVVVEHFLRGLLVGS